MELTVLGSGTSVPHPKRTPSAYWLETSAGSILLDCSISAPHRMAEEGLDWANIGAVWISHFHLDHCGGLAPFLAGTKHAKATMARTAALRIFAPKGFERLFNAFDSANNYRLRNQPFEIQITEVASLSRFEILPSVEAVAVKTPHTDESHAIHIRDADDSTLFYSADTGFGETLASAARQVDLFVLECAYVENKAVAKHLELAEAMHLIRKAAPKKAMLTHLYPEWDEANFDEKIAGFSPGCEVLEAFDGLRVII